MRKTPIAANKQLLPTLRLVSQTARLWWLNTEVENTYIKSLDEKLTSTDIQTLWELGVTGAIRPSELARKLGLDKASATRRLSRLSDSGLIEHIPDPKDGRATLVGLSDKGVSIVERSYAQSNEAFTWMIEKWSDEEINVFNRLLHDYIDKTYEVLERHKNADAHSFESKQ